MPCNKSKLRPVNCNENGVSETDQVVPIDDPEHETNKENIHCNENNEPKVKMRTDRATKYGFSLPPEPIGECPQKAQRNVIFLQDRAIYYNVDMNTTIKESWCYKNPNFYPTMIQRYNIDELGTNFPPEVYDPAPWIGMFLKFMLLNI